MFSNPWLPVVGYEDTYMVSSEGQVRRVEGGRWQRSRHGGMRYVNYNAMEMSLWNDKDGYPQATLTVNGQKEHKKVHRMVLEAFVGPCPAGMEACHNDGIRDHNHVANLRWDTISANRLDSFKHNPALQKGENNANYRHGRHVK